MYLTYLFISIGHLFISGTIIRPWWEYSKNGKSWDKKSGNNNNSDIVDRTTFEGHYVMNLRVWYTIPTDLRYIYPTSTLYSPSSRNVICRVETLTTSHSAFPWSSLVNYLNLHNTIIVSNLWSKFMYIRQRKFVSGLRQCWFYICFQKLRPCSLKRVKFSWILTPKFNMEFRDQSVLIRKFVRN